MNVELYDALINALVGLVSACVPILTGYAAMWLRERTKASTIDRLGSATGRAGGLVVDAMQQAQMQQSTDLEAVKQQAIKTAVDNVIASFGKEISKLGGTPDKVEAMVRGEVGKLLAPALMTSKGA